MMMKNIERERRRRRRLTFLSGSFGATMIMNQLISAKLRQQTTTESQKKENQIIVLVRVL